MTRLGEYDVVRLRMPGCGGLSVGIACAGILTSLFFWQIFRLLWGRVPALYVLYAFLLLVPGGALCGLLLGLLALWGSERRSATLGVLLNLLILLCAAVAIALSL